MTNKSNRGRYFFANRMHRQLFWAFSVAAILPTLLSVVGLYYLIFNITADQIGFPEAIAYNLIPAAKRVSSVLAVLLPLVIGVILFLAHRISHAIVGPFDRIVRELNECTEEKRKGPIIVRQADRFKPLVDAINALLGRLEQSE